MLHVSAKCHLLPVAAVHVDLMDVPLDRLAKHFLSISRPPRSTTRLLGFELRQFLTVEVENKNADVAQMPAGDSKTFAVRTPSRHATTLPSGGRDPLFSWDGFQIRPTLQLPNKGLVVSNKQDRFAVRRPIPL